MENKKLMNKQAIEQVPKKIATAINDLNIEEAITVGSDKRATVGSAIMYLKKKGIDRSFTTRKIDDRLIVIRTK